MSSTLTTAATPAVITPEDIAREVLRRLEDAWNRGDGQAFGAVYAEDAYFVTIRGEHLRGQAQIAGGHAGIFATIYAGSTNRMELIEARRIAQNVVVSTSTGTLDAPHGPLQGVHTAMSTSVLVRQAGGEWLIVATHNTLVGAR
jgi:uncharacterized protein (TIGR02246 family)